MQPCRGRTNRRNARRTRQNAGRAAAGLAHGAVGHDVADLVGDEVAAVVDQGHGIAGILRDQLLGIVERQRNTLVAERAALILPPEVLAAASCVRKGASEESEDLRFIAARETRGS